MKNKDRQYYQLIPEKVFQQLNTIEDKIRPGIKGYSKDCLMEVISIIARFIRKDEDNAEVLVKDFKKLVPQGDKYLKGLIGCEVVIRSGKYLIGESSYCYSFSPVFKSRYVKSPLNNNFLIRRIQKVLELQTKKAIQQIRGHSEQKKFLEKLTIDPSYLDFIHLNYIEETNKYNYIVASAVKIENKDIFCSIDSTSGRFHSNVTNMSKDLRPFLRINGEPLVNIDIKNSQPYLSTILLSEPSKVSHLTNNRDFDMMLQTLEVEQKQDIKDYISLVITGQLYEYLMKEFNKEGIELTRAETKTQVLRILFASNRVPKNLINLKCRNIFKEVFPTVHEVFSVLRGSKMGDKFTNYKRFAILLQSIESHLILNVIMKRIFKELPGIPVLTIHDSIMTTKNNVVAVSKIMIEELTFFVGKTPKITIEGNN